MNSDEFCRELGFIGGLEREICEKIREATAAECRMDKDIITPSDDTHVLNRKTFNGWDDCAFLMRLEEMFEVELDEIQLPAFTLQRFFLFFGRKGPANYGEWVRKAVKTLRPAIAKQLEQSAEN